MSKLREKEYEKEQEASLTDLKAKAMEKLGAFDLPAPEDVEKYEEQVEKTLAMADELKQNLEKALEEKENLEKQLDIALEDSNLYVKENADLNKEKEKLNADLEDLAQQNETLQKENKTLTKQNEKLKKLQELLKSAE